MKGLGLSHSVRGAEPHAGFEEDEILHFMRKLAEHGVVATLSANGVAKGHIDTDRWAFHALGPGVATRGATVGACLDVALPPLRDAGLPVGAGTTRVREGIGVLVLDWLVDQGMTVFLKADGGRRVPGWTLIVDGGPLLRMQRFDGPRIEKCLRRLVHGLEAGGLRVPV
ncbi:hypothetical protein [Streptomyces lydicus]|uniref:hypothetical protein n=1 Tax=Streptomyces lydicus TaxID=47763 RepID=UPI00371B210E